MSKLQFVLRTMLYGFIGGLLLGFIPVLVFHFSLASIWGYFIGIVLGQVLVAFGGTIYINIRQKRKHELILNDRHHYECVVCGQYWIGASGAEYSTCPGTHCYDLLIPDHLLTKRRLRMIGYRPSSARVGCNEDHEDLYDICDTVPLSSATPAQVEAMQHMREARIQELEQAVLRELEQ